MMLLPVYLVFAAPVPAPIPAAPLAPAPSFAAQVSGRAALADAMYALITAPKQSYTANLRLAAFDESGKAQFDLSVRETLALDRANGKVALTLTRTDVQEATRFVANGDGLLLAKLAGGKRTFARVPQDTSVPLRNLLFDADADKAFQTGTTRTALFSTLGDDSIRFGGTVYTDTDGAIVEQLPPTDDGGHTKRIYRRYRLLPKTGKIASWEEWATWQDAGKPLVVRSYRSETLIHKPPVFTVATFSTKPAPGYAEVAPPPSRPAPILSGPDTCDPRARPLLTRWTRAASHIVTLDSHWYIAQGLKAQTPESPAVPEEPEREAFYDIAWSRPARIRFLLTPTATKKRETPNLFNEPLLAVGNGVTVATFDGAKLTHRRGEFNNNNDDNALWYTLYRAGMWDYTQMIAFLLWNPQAILDNVETVTYRGTLPLPGGGTAEAVDLVVRYSESGERRKSKPGSDVTNQTNTITVYFDPATGLPRRIEQFRHYFATDGTTQARDMRPNETFVATADRLSVNRSLSPALFVLPDAPPK